MVIDIQNVSKAYGNVKALDGVSLQIKDLDRVAVLGESGSGKSTLLHILAGLQTADSGSITCDAKPLENKPYKRGIAMVFQDPALWNHMSVRANIGFGCPVQGRKNRQEYVRKLAAELGIEELLNRRPYEISGGQARRVAIARALACKRPLLLLDEAFSNLDEATKKITMDVVRKYSDGTAAVVLVTHDEREAESFCDTFYCMEKGHLT